MLANISGCLWTAQTKLAHTNSRYRAASSEWRDCLELWGINLLLHHSISCQSWAGKTQAVMVFMSPFWSSAVLCFYRTLLGASFLPAFCMPQPRWRFLSSFSPKRPFLHNLRTSL